MRILERNVYVGPSLYAHFQVIKLVLDLGPLEDWPTGDRLFKRPFPSQSTPPPSFRTPAHMLVGYGRSLVKADHGPEVCRS